MGLHLLGSPPLSFRSACTELTARALQRNGPSLAEALQQEQKGRERSGVSPNLSVHSRRAQWNSSWLSLISLKGMAAQLLNAPYSKELSVAIRKETLERKSSFHPGIQRCSGDVCCSSRASSNWDCAGTACCSHHGIDAGPLRLCQVGERSTIRHSTARCSMVQHGPVQYSTAQSSTAQHGTAQHNIAQHSAVQHGMAQHGMTQHGTEELQQLRIFTEAPQPLHFPGSPSP